GSRLAERLYLDEKADVCVMVHSWPKAAWSSRLGVELTKADITNYAEVDEAVEGCEIVFHCVGVGGTREQAMKINVEGTRNVLMACQKHKVKRVVYLSSVVVHGDKIFDGMDENTSFASYGDAYADAKIEAEKVFWELIKEYNLEGSVVRPTYVWGPLSQYYSIDYVQQMKKKTFYLVDNGEHDCNAVYVDNVVDLTLLCAHHPKAVGEAFNATDGEQLKWKDFFAFYANMLNTKIETFKSIPTIDGLDRKMLKFAKQSLLNMIAPITLRNDKLEQNNPQLAKWLCKAPRKLLKIPLKKIQNILPEMDAVEMSFYSFDGFISIAKSEKILAYKPRISVAEGMKSTEIWLKDQNHI
ncbi:MAG: NAD-dependent epimerase/dehydratase family protein, partial [Ferruginibacter sp.]